MLGQRCAISRCGSRLCTFNKNVSFFKLPPMGTVRRKKWLNSLNVPLRCDSKGQGTLCSLHFNANDILQREVNGVKQTMLRSDAVPTLSWQSVQATVQIDTNTTIEREPITASSSTLAAARQECGVLKKKNETLVSKIRTLPKSHLNTKYGINCGICDTVLTYDKLMVHLCMDQHEIKCEDCSKTFKSTIDFRLHFSDTEHFNIKYHKCDKCEKSFPSALLLKFHVNSSQTHLTSKVMETHPNNKTLKVSQLTGNVFGCGYCDMSFENTKRLANHMKFHQTHSDVMKTRFECYICGSGWSTLDKMLKHFKSHGITRDNKCKICDEMLSLDELKIHFCFMETTIKCEYCTRTFNVTIELLQHLNDDHDDKIRYICPILKCCRYFEMKCFKELHEKQHGEQRAENNFLCEICAKGYEKEQHLEQHLKSHSNERNHICAKCNKAFKSNSGLRTHMLTHEEKTYECPDCPASFKNPSKLRRHSAVHQDLKYHCDECNKIFSSDWSLKSHIRKIHKGLGIERKFSCSLCSMKCSTKNKLSRHMESHSNEKPFSCEYCDRKYKYTGDLRKHLQTHVGNDIYKCNECGNGFRYQADLVRHSFEHHKQRKNAENQ